jgi:phosphatidylinositol phospholipase C beta
MYGLPTDTIRREFRTKTVPNNGLNPYYNEDAFVFRKIILPDLACLRIAVFEETGKMIGQRVLPLDGLQAGYRHISLRTEGNFPLSLPTLFCHIVLKTYVPDGLGDFVDALNNPKEFLTKEDKRLKQLQDALVVEDEKHLLPNDQKNSASGLERNGSIFNKNDRKLSVISDINGKKVPPLEVAAVRPVEKITSDNLRLMRSFQKLFKKQAKEKEMLKRKHFKERSVLQKQHAILLGKIHSNNNKSNVETSNQINNNISSSAHSNSSSACNLNNNGEKGIKNQKSNASFPSTAAAAVSIPIVDIETNDSSKAKVHFLKLLSPHSHLIV